MLIVQWLSGVALGTLIGIYTGKFLCGEFPKVFKGIPPFRDGR